ncbi:MAG: hypothetical protein AAB152_00110 [Candidatus Coatesbacteria bacterium]
MTIKRYATMILLATALLAAGGAYAWLETGTLLTNAASATYQNYGGQSTVTYSATMRVVVMNPYLFVWKDCTPTYVTTIGGYVTYTLSFSNGGANSAFNVTLNDIMPNGSGVWWIGYAGHGAWSGTGVPAPSWSANGTTWAPGTPGFGQQGPLSLRWIVPSLPAGASGIVTYVVSLG